MTALYHDTRGVSELLGFLLVLVILLVTLATLQATALPAWTADTEQSHNVDVQEDIVDLRSAIFQTAGSGNDRAQGVQLGTDYPSRLVFINPPAAAGTLETEEQQSITLQNIDALGHKNARSYWDARTAEGGQTLPTRGLTYTPSYNEYDTAPKTRLEHGVLYNAFDGDIDLIRANRDIVDDNRITLAALDGELEKTGIERQSIETLPASAPSQRIAVGGADGDPIELAVPTELDEETWQEILADEIEPAGSLLEPPAVEDGELQLSLNGSERYQLRLAKVGVGEEVDREEPAYIVTDGRAAVSPNEDFAVEVRDRFNNPVPGADVDIETPQEPDPQCSVGSTATTDENGQIVGSCGESAALNFSLPDVSASYGSVSVSVGQGAEPAFARPVETEGRTEILGPGNTEYSQIEVDYELDSDFAGIATVSIKVYDGDEQITASTQQYAQDDVVESDLDGQWISPWLEATAAEVETYEVRISIKDTGGNHHDRCTLNVGESGCGT